MNSMREAYERGSKHSGKGGEKELKRVTIQESDNGGFIVECEYQTKHENDGDGPVCASYETSKKVFENWDKVADLLDDLYGDGDDEEKEEEE